MWGVVDETRSGGKGLSTPVSGSSIPKRSVDPPPLLFSRSEKGRALQKPYIDR
jgi:hypothetical protein